MGYTRRQIRTGVSALRRKLTEFYSSIRSITGKVRRTERRDEIMAEGFTQDQDPLEFFQNELGNDITALYQVLKKYYDVPHLREYIDKGNDFLMESRKLVNQIKNGKQS